jgi:hypothetical protein
MVTTLRKNIQLVLLVGLISNSPLAWPRVQASRDVRELQPGAPIERELKGGEVHAYRLTLVVGQYLRVVVEQRGIDVVVTLAGPDGQKITEVDSPNGSQGPEPVSVVAEASGTYRLEVRSLEKTAAAGRYEVKIEELRGGGQFVERRRQSDGQLDDAVLPRDAGPRRAHGGGPASGAGLDVAREAPAILLGGIRSIG